MGFFDNFIGGIKNVGSSVVGAVKTVGKKVGQAAGAAMDYSRQHEIGSTLQSVGTSLALGGLAIGSTGIGAPVAAGLETLAGGLVAAGTGLRAAEIATDTKSSMAKKLESAATDVALPLLLPGVSKVAGKAGSLAVRKVGKAGIETGLKFAQLPGAARMYRPGTIETVRSVSKGIRNVSKGVEFLGNNPVLVDAAMRAGSALTNRQ